MRHPVQHLFSYGALVLAVLVSVTAACGDHTTQTQVPKGLANCEGSPERINRLIESILAHQQLAHAFADRRRVALPTGSSGCFGRNCIEYRKCSLIHRQRFIQITKRLLGCTEPIQT